MKTSLCLEAAERPQWARLYLLSRPRSRSRMPSLVGDRGLELRVVRNILDYAPVAKGAEEWLCVEQTRELFSDIRGRGGASNACFHS